MHGKLPILGIERRLHALGIAGLQEWHIHHGYHHRIAHNTLLGFVIQRGPLLLVALPAASLDEVINPSVMREITPLVARGWVWNFFGIEEQPKPHVTVGNPGATIEHEWIEVLADIVVIGGVLDELSFNVDAHLLELLLYQRQHLGVEKGLIDEVVLDGETMGMPGFSEQFFGLVRIVVRQLHWDMHEVARRQGLIARFPRAPGYSVSLMASRSSAYI